MEKENKLPIRRIFAESRDIVIKSFGLFFVVYLALSFYELLYSKAETAIITVIVSKMLQIFAETISPAIAAILNLFANFISLYGGAELVDFSHLSTETVKAGLSAPINYSLLSSSTLFLLLSSVFYIIAQKLIYDKFMTNTISRDAVFLFIRKNFIPFFLCKMLFAIFFALSAFLSVFIIFSVIFILGSVVLLFSGPLILLALFLIFYFSIRLSFVLFIFLFEKQNILFALRESFASTKGKFWRLVLLHIPYIIGIYISHLDISSYLFKINGYSFSASTILCFLIAAISFTFGAFCLMNAYIHLRRPYLHLPIEDKTNPVIMV